MLEQVKIEDLSPPATKGDLQAGFETFASMVKQGFDGIGKRFDAVDERFERVEGKISDLTGHMQRIDNRLARHQDVIDTSKLHIATLDTRFVAVERKVGLPTKPLQA